MISNDGLNHGPAQLAVVAPFTTHDRRAPLWVLVEAARGWVEKAFVRDLRGVRSISTERLIRRLGSVGAATLGSVEDRLRVLFAL